METAVKNIQDNYKKVTNQIQRAAENCGRSPDQVHLVVVTKGQSPIKMKAVIEAGATILGENYPEETLQKIGEMGETIKSVQLHMIGHLQSRKVAMVADHFAALHSLDSLLLAEKLSKKLAANNKTLPAMLEINVSGEESKFGFDGTNESQWPLLIPVISDIIRLPGLNICGLMTMPPYFDDPEMARPYFIKLRQLRDYLKETIPLCGFEELSMGTSHDFEVAIQEGATYVRVGEAIMGDRFYPQKRN